MEYQYKLRPHHGLCISFFSDYKMEVVVLLIRFENMIKRFLNYVDGKKECYFRILNLNKIFMIIFCLVESVKQFVVIVNGAKFVT